MKNLKTYLAVLLALTFMVSACGGNPMKPSPDPTPMPKPSPTVVRTVLATFITDPGDLDPGRAFGYGSAPLPGPFTLEVTFTGTPVAPATQMELYIGDHDAPVIGCNAEGCVNYLVRVIDTPGGPQPLRATYDVPRGVEIRFIVWFRNAGPGPVARGARAEIAVLTPAP